MKFLFRHTSVDCEGCEGQCDAICEGYVHPEWALIFMLRIGLIAVQMLPENTQSSKFSSPFSRDVLILCRGSFNKSYFCLTCFVLFSLSLRIIVQRLKFHFIFTYYLLELLIVQRLKFHIIFRYHCADWRCSRNARCRCFAPAAHTTEKLYGFLFFYSGRVGYPFLQFFCYTE